MTEPRKDSPLGPRPRSLPLAPTAAPGKRKLPLADSVRAKDQRAKPNYAVWEITLACDLACRHCGSRAGKARPDELSTEECLDLVDQMADLGVLEVTLIGGEAYLRDDFPDIIRRIRARGMACSTTTGARNFTREKILAARDAGLQGIAISIDGLRDTHDALRAVAGSFHAAIQTMRTVRDVGGIRLTCNSQINRANLAELDELYDLLAREGMRAWQTQLTAAMGRAADEPDVLLQPYEVLEVIPRLTRIGQRAKAAGIRMWPGNNIGYYGTFESILRGHINGKRRGSCGAGISTLGIEANGAIKGCPSLPSADYTGGNIRDEKLEDIWRRSEALRFMRDHQPEQLSGFCATCYYASECKGGCQWTAHVLLGHRGNNPYCHHRAQTLLERGLRERVEVRAPAPGEPFDHGTYVIIEEPWPDPAERARYEAMQSLDGLR